MSHQHGQIYLMRGCKAPIQHTTPYRTCHCRTYSYVCSCTTVLPLPGTPTIPEYKRRCRVTGWYTTGCPWLIPCLVTLILQPFPRRPSHQFPVTALIPRVQTLSCGSCRTVASATKMFCKTNVCICTLDRVRNPITGGDVNRRWKLASFALTLCSRVHGVTVK